MKITYKISGEEFPISSLPHYTKSSGGLYGWIVLTRDLRVLFFYDGVDYDDVTNEFNIEL